MSISSTFVLFLTALALLVAHPSSVICTELDPNLWRSASQDPWAIPAAANSDPLAPFSLPTATTPPSSPPPKSSGPRRSLSMTDVDYDVVPFAPSSLAEADDASAPDAPSAHTFRPMQVQPGTVFNMTRRTAFAPFSHRIQPGLAYRTRAITYAQVNTNLNIRLGPGYLLMYEGAMTGGFNGTNLVENDVWVSNDDGVTWDLIRGVSVFGRSGVVAAVNPNSFVGRRGSNNCGDPLSDILMSLGGVNLVTNNASTISYHSFNGEQWNQRFGSFAPGRHFSSCDIDESGHGFVIGGHYSNTAVPQDYFLNDVWVTSALWTNNPWRRITDKAPFSAREEHLVLVANAPALKREVIYVIGGKVTCNNFDCYDGYNANDVWASSDAGESWAVITAQGPFGPRWGHGGWVNQDGVLLMWGGLNSVDGTYGRTTTWREMWASFNGGYQWHSCTLPPNALFIRGEQGATVNANGQLILVGGYSYGENGVPGSQIRFNDVWRTDFSVENTALLAQRCGGAATVIPAAGVGLRSWPGNPTVPANTLTFSPLTRRAPWSPRIQPALLLMNQPQTYVNPTDKSTGTTGPNWLLMYEGSLTAGAGPNSNENDVYASIDGGHTWILISGIARLGGQGEVNSAFPDASFRATSGAGNCEDPTSDDVYASGGIRALNNSYTDYSTETWYSSDAIHWTLRSGPSFSPGRYFHSCDVDNSGRVYIIGGRAFGPIATSFLNDIWTSTDKAQTWTRLTAAAPFSGRYEHSVQIVHSPYYKKDLIYVAAGYINPGGLQSAGNDVWVSSDSAMTWMQLTAAAPWGSRWGHGAAITEAGVLLILGGTSAQQTSYSDLWASFDGGVTWHSCHVEANSTVIRGEQAVALTAEEKLIVGNGYRYMYNGGYRIEYSDLWVSDMRMNDTAALARMCATTVPAAGVGLRIANWQAASSSAAVAVRASSSSSAAPVRTSSSSSTGGRRASSSSSSARMATSAKQVACPYWADGQYQPKCYCPEQSTGDYPDCMCPARYGRNAYVPDDCMDLYPDPDDPYSPTGTNAATTTSSGGMSGATIAAIICVVVAVFVITGVAYFHFVNKRSPAPNGFSLGSGDNGRSSLLGGGTQSHSSDSYSHPVVGAPSTGLDYYLSQDPQGGHLRPAAGQELELPSTAEEGRFRAV